jgi:SAM-dependent methyltransferase
MKNASQIDDWNGATGARWVDNQERLDRILAPYGDAALAGAAARPGEAVLDIGCGAGVTTLALAASVLPDGRVVGVDISEPLVARARERTAAAAMPIDFRLEDAGRAALPDAAFDLLFSRFGVMFFDAPTEAFRHMRTALKPGGRLTFICWRSAAENDWAKLPIAALRGIVPIPESNPDAPGPYAFGNRLRVEAILADAGFIDVEIKPFDAPLLYGIGASREAALDDAMEYMTQIGPVPRLLADKPDDVREKAMAAVRAALETRLSDAGVIIDGAAWVVTGSNP